VEIAEDPMAEPDDGGGLAVDERPERIAIAAEDRVDDRAVVAGRGGVAVLRRWERGFDGSGSGAVTVDRATIGPDPPPSCVG